MQMRMRIRDLVNPGSGIEKIESGIQVTVPNSRINIPDPQHCLKPIFTWPIVLWLHNTQGFIERLHGTYDSVSDRLEVDST